MKKMICIALACVAAFAVQAQSTRPGLTRAEAVKTLTVSKEAIVVGYEQVISPGRLSLTKAYMQADDGKAFTTIYTLRIGADNSFNNRQPVRIGISRKSFDSVFTRGSAEMAAKYPALNKYVNSNNIPLNEEKGWVELVRFFNTL